MLTEHVVAFVFHCGNLMQKQGQTFHKEQCQKTSYDKKLHI